MSSVQEIFNEIKTLNKDEKVMLMNLVFLDSSFEILDIVRIKENELKIKLQREHEMLIMADTRMAIIIHNEWKMLKKDREFMKQQLHKANIHLAYSKHASIVMENSVTEEEINEYDKEFSYNKDLYPNSWYSNLSAHLH